MGLNEQTHAHLADPNDSEVALMAKKPVELVLAEADSTFWEEELDGLTATATECQFIQSKPVVLLPPKCSTVEERMEKRMKLSTSAQPTALTVPIEHKEVVQISASTAGRLKRKLKKPVRPSTKQTSEQASPTPTSELCRAPVGSGSFLCKACNRNLSTEYSLKRHKQICQKHKDTNNGHTDDSEQL